MFLRNVTTVTLSPPRIKETNLRIGEGEITDEGQFLRPRRDEAVIDLKGKFVMPGFVNAHTHLYSSLSRGMPAPRPAPKNFVEILEKVWWPLDESLDRESVYLSALVGAIESVKLGTTTIIDHHASPNYIIGSLDLIKKALTAVGLRGILCYETTDRGGAKRRAQGLAENKRFLCGHVDDSHFRGMIGAHASFTLDDSTLSELGDLERQHTAGIHIHVAEDKADVRDALEKRKTDIIDRLEKFGLLTKRSILAHGVHLSRRQIRKINKHGSRMVHNARSNMNNAVGYAPVKLFASSTALGTDGFPSDMFEEAKLAYFRNAESNARLEFSRIPEMLQAGNVIASTIFGKNFGTIEKGNVADLVVLDYLPPTPMTKENLAAHFLFGMRSSMVESVMIGGKWVVKHREVVGIDVPAVYNKADAAARKLWTRIQKRQ